MVAPPKPIDITVAQAVDRYLDLCRARVAVGDLSPASVDNYTQNLYMMLKLLDPVKAAGLLDELTGEDIDTLTLRFANTPDFRVKEGRVSATKSVSAQRIFRSVLSAFFTVAKAQRWIQESPLDYASLTPGKVKAVDSKRKALTMEQAQAVLKYGAGSLEQAVTPRQKIAYYGRVAVLWVLLYTGARNSELTGANRGDFQPATDTAGVGAFWAVRGKGGKQRVVPVPAAAWILLREFWAQVDQAVREGKMPADTDLEAAFISSWGKRMNMMGVNRVVDRARDEVRAVPGLEHLGRDMVPHAFRHTTATLMLASDEGNLPMVRDMLGHSNIALTSLYLDTSVDSLAEMMGAHPLQDGEGPAGS